MATNNAANINTTGIQSLNSSGAFNGRTITGTANQITVTNGDGTGGNPTLALTSTIQVTGISFDSGTNTLSTYTQGTYTPTITNTGTAPTISYTTQLGRYTKIGNRVIQNIVVQPSSYVAGTGNAQISAFPFTSNSTSNNNNVGSINAVNITFGASVLYYDGVLAANVTSMDIVGMRSGTTALNLVAGGITSSSNLFFTIVYEV